MKRSRPLLKQRLCGVLLILLGVGFLLAVSSGPSIEDRDAAGAILVIPFGLYLLLTRRIVIDWRR